MELSEKRKWRNEIRYKVETFTCDRTLSIRDWGRFDAAIPGHGDYDYIYGRLHGERVGMVEVVSPVWAVEDEIPW